MGKTGLESPADILYNLALHMQFVWFRQNSSSPRYKRSPGGPGAVIQKLPESTRAVLRELKSSDIASIRTDAVIL